MGDQWYTNTANAVIIDDRGVAVFRSGQALLSDERAEKIRAIRPGQLPLVDAPVAHAEPEPEQVVEVEVVTDDDPDGDPSVDGDPRVAALALHYKRRIMLAERLGAGTVSRAEADDFIANLPDDALPALAREVDEIGG